MSANRGFKKGDHVVVTSHEFDVTPSGRKNDSYGFGVTGVIDGFRNNRFHGRQAVVRLDHEPDAYVDWSLTMIAKVREEPTLAYCPQSGSSPGEDNSTHHLLPRAGGMTCRYCKRTERELREAN